MTYKALDIAKKILAKASFSDAGAGERISNMKLQKLLYYQQGFHLAYFGTPLFNENIEAWMYGPVVLSVYNHYKEWNDKGIEDNIEDNKNIITLQPKEEALFDEVYKVYDDFSAIGLMNLTHSESPWKETPVGKGSVISNEKMITFFRKKLK
ncbi:MAG: DUF4065 domain-containing protein [Paludibacter sp.]|jgi:uncharacterized phage-associated protein|nr:DUF4065 domain-containing protein [Paludibacter sp.]